MELVILTQQQKNAAKGTLRPPPIILTTTVNVLKFQAEVKAITRGSFEFHNTRNGIRVVTKEIAQGGTKIVNLLFFLVTLARKEKSPEVFNLTRLSHVVIKVEAHRAQNILMQCCNCQKFGHVWANCKQPARCVWCGGVHIHK